VTHDPSPDQAAPNGSGVPGEPGAAAPRTPRPSDASGRRSQPGARTRPVQYRGDDLDAARGPGLGCFWSQVIVLAALVVLTPLTVSLGWPSEVSAFLLFATIGLLLLTGQTIIFLLRLVAAERRGRRRPLASGTKTVVEIEDGGPRTVDAGPTTAADPTTAAGPATDAAMAADPSTLAPEARAGSDALDPTEAEPNPPDDVRQ